MNKLVKGSIAGAAGIALLLGGAGTFALWNDSITANAGTVSSGQLRIADSTTPGGSWTDQSSSIVAGSGTALPTTTTGTAPNQVITVTPKIVPGDKWRYTRQIVLTTTGKNLLADLSFDPASITNNLPAGEFTYALTATPVASAGAATLAETGTGTNVFRVTPGTAATTTVNVTLDIIFTNVTAAGGNLTAGQNQTINVSALKFNLAQVRP